MAIKTPPPETWVIVLMPVSYITNAVCAIDCKFDFRNFMTGNPLTFSEVPTKSAFLLHKKRINLQGLKNAGLIIGFYTFLIVLFLPQLYFYSTESNNPSIGLWVGRLALAHYLWAMLTPIIFRLGSRFPVERRNLLRSLPAHFIFSILFSAVHTITYHYILGFFFGEALSEINKALFGSWGRFFNNITNGFIFYAGILAFSQALNYSRKYRDREFRLQQAELEVLKTQLHPHFLFNTLNAIAALVYVSPPAATKTISQLSDLLRLSLHNDKAQEVTLKEEIDFLRKYLQIQQTLFQERLQIEWKIQPETLDALVPNMILQPLVENSIKHGIDPKEEGGCIEIYSQHINDNLLLEVKDNGLGIGNKKAVNHKGIGLINSKARLNHLYGEAQKFEVNSPSEGGWRVRMLFPFQEKQRYKQNNENSHFNS